MQVVTPAVARDLSPAIAALREHAASTAAVEALFAAHAIPLIEGTASTFVWRGDADSVAVDHRVMGLTLPLPMHRIANSDLWYATVELPQGARIEYRILVRRGDSVENILDPSNPRVAVGPVGEMSVLEADGYVTPDWANHDPAVQPGSLTTVRIKSRALRRHAELTVYAPARLEGGRQYPLLIVHDGGDFLGYSSFGTVLDNLMHRGLIAHCFVAFTHPKDRMREYNASPAHSRFLNDEIVPELERTLPLRADPQSRVLLGASLGAVASLAAAVRAPGMYGGLFLESGSFRSSEAEFERAGFPPLKRMARFVRSLRVKPLRVTNRLFQVYGAFEPLAQPNREFTAVLRRMTDEIRVSEAPDGHSWINWRDRLLDGLSWLLPPGADEHPVERST
jgi:enterochelin esterase-like enzyme